jgi:hypothetical protein
MERLNVLRVLAVLTITPYPLHALSVSRKSLYLWMKLDLPEVNRRFRAGPLSKITRSC